MPTTPTTPTTNPVTIRRISQRAQRMPPPPRFRCMVMVLLAIVFSTPSLARACPATKTYRQQNAPRAACRCAGSQRTLVAAPARDDRRRGPRSGAGVHRAAVIFGAQLRQAGPVEIAGTPQRLAPPPG